MNTSFGNLVQNILNTVMDALRQKNQEKMTIMIIPHSQDKIFSVHISWLMIIFLAGTLALVIGITSYGKYNQAKAEAEVEELRSLYGVNFQNAVNLQKAAHSIIETNSRLTDNLKTIAVQSGFSDESTGRLPDYSDARSIAESSLRTEILKRAEMAPGSNYLQSVYSYKTNTVYFSEISPLLYSLSSFIGDGLGIYNAKPMGRPVRMSGLLRDTSPYGIRLDPVTRSRLEFHTGMDIAGPYGTPIYATASGTVAKAYFMGAGYGNFVVVDHEFGYQTLYGHLSKFIVKNGQRIRKGQLIGYMGATGRVTGVHLHYEIFLANNRIDPKSFLCSVDFKSLLCRRFHAGSENN